MKAPTDPSGFSVLEALVAVAIAGAVLVPIVGVQIEFTRQHQRQVALQKSILAKRNALAVLGSVNVMAEPRGRRTLADDYELSWTARPVVREKRSLRFLAGEGDFMVGLYQVRATITDDRQDPVASLEVEKLGWRRITRS